MSVVAMYMSTLDTALYIKRPYNVSKEVWSSENRVQLLLLHYVHSSFCIHTVFYHPYIEAFLVLYNNRYTKAALPVFPGQLDAQTKLSSSANCKRKNKHCRQKLQA